MSLKALQVPFYLNKSGCCLVLLIFDCRKEFAYLLCIIFSFPLSSSYFLVNNNPPAFSKALIYETTRSTFFHFLLSIKLRYNFYFIKFPYLLDLDTVLSSTWGLFCILSSFLGSSDFLRSDPLTLSGFFPQITFSAPFTLITTLFFRRIFNLY